MGVAADCKYVSQYGSRDNATKQILSNWNSASTLFKVRQFNFLHYLLNFWQNTLNVSLGILELQILDPICPPTPPPATPWNIDCDTTLNERLSLFSAWRGQKGSDNIGLWHLMSGCPTGTEVGIAWLATLYVSSLRPAPRFS